MKKTFILMIVLLSVAYVSNGQTADRKWSLGLHGGINQYAGDLGNGFYNCKAGLYGMGGLDVSRYLNRFFDISIMMNYGNVGFKLKDETNVEKMFKTSMLHANLHVKLKFLGNDKYKLQPFIFGGIGLESFTTKSPWWTADKVKSTDESFVTGFGLTWHVAPSVSLQWMDNFIFTDYDRVDHNWGSKYYDYYMQHSLGVEYNFGKMKDTDKDGIADNKDKCPMVFGLAKFEGCPDSDNDGIVDADDRCPGTPSGVKVDGKGCPLDTDSDGIADYQDKCPDVKGLGALQGCPDTDGDGVADAADKCPNTPVNVKVDAMGCPLDMDGDGVADFLDKCPGTPPNVKVDANGCPMDRDGDGVPDYLDKCPDVKGTEANKGCPEVKKEVMDVFQKALQGIQFETGKDVIRPVSFGILDNVVSIMKENTEYNLKINGHTDNVGKPEANMTLSQKRAEAVKAYLVKKGVEAGRLSAFGFGDTKAVGDNKTAEGRAKNRRVEFVVEF
jgi:OmpA-OmpF porin, OOP family